jgi:hypothetical protein
MPRANRVEMTPIERRDLDDAEPLGNSNDCCVGSTEREVGVDLHQLGHPHVVDQLKIDNRQRRLDDRAQERRLNLRAARPAKR